MNFRKLIFAFIALVIFVSLFTGCDKRNMDVKHYNIVSITADPDTIYADNNITSSDISVIVKDDDNFAVVEETVVFRSSIGNILYDIPTDSTGKAVTTFWDAGEQGTAIIEAFIGDEKKSVTVQVDPKPEIQNLSIDLNSDELNVDEISTVRVYAQSSVGNVPDGTLIVLQTTEGFFQDDQGTDQGNTVQIVTSNSMAKAIFNAGQQKGTAHLTAKLGDVTALADIEIHPGAPRFMYLTPTVSEIQANSGEQVPITAQVQDRYHNPVERGVGVDFTTNLGSVDEFDDTDTLGVAITNFSPGIEAGSATVSAKADSAEASTVISIISNEINSIEFTNTTQIDIQVQGTGGQESYALSVNLYDMNGNLIDDDVWVYFELINPPSGTNINEVGLIDSTMSSHGSASVSINSGTESGPVTMKAYAYKANGDQVVSLKSNIIIHAGPPNSVAFSIGGNDTGENMGGGLWKVQIAALINDQWGNPVGEGTAVFFSLTDDPDWATIETANAYVGNYNTAGDSLAGTAFSFLDYDGSHTNDDVSIMLEIGDFSYTGTLILPIQFAVMDVVVLPQHLDWVQGSPNNQTVQVIITVKDGQNNLIHGQTVTTYGTLGNPVPGDNFEMITNSEGIIDRDWQFHKYECPPPLPDGTPGTTTAQITSQLVGINVSVNFTVILIRYE